MRLTAIKLAGFKSFVDPTTMALDASLTGIVGPNGCGKSNVIDAVRWVTGESSAKQLRGEALEDVIFNGSRGRKPVGRASVELKFDNSEGKIGGQYARFSEISIRRELTREGGSRYFINGSRARRRDVVDLFLGTGLGGRSNYAVIEQGAVNRLVEAKPDDMRQVLEETAGISRYRERRRETENRIRHTRENLDRLNDLISEVTQRLSVLKRQARNAEKYKRLKQDERRLRAELLALRWRSFDADVHAARTKLDQHEKALAEAVSAQRQAREERDAQVRAQQAAAEACQKHQEAFYAAQGEATRIAQALEHARRMNEMRQRERDDLENRYARLQAREAEDRDALGHIEQAIAEGEAGLAERRQKRDAARVRLEKSEAEVGVSEKRWSDYSGEHTPLAQLEAERTQRHYLAQRIEQTKAANDKRRAEAEALALDDTENALHALDGRVQAQDRQVTADEDRVRDRAEALADLAGRKSALTDKTDEARTRLARLQARIASEKTMQQGVLREDDEHVHAWLCKQGHADAQSVARTVEAPAQWQTAVESALADWLSGFTVERLPATESMQEWPASSVTLVESDGPDGAAGTGTVGGLHSLASRIKAPAPVMAAAARIYVADDVGTALRVRAELEPGQMIVCLDGACIGPGTLRTPAAESATTGVLERERNIKLLAEEQAATAAHLEELQAELSALARRLQSEQEQHHGLEQDLSRAREELSRNRAEQQGLRERLQQRRQRAEELAQEQTRLSQQLAQDNEELLERDARISDLGDQVETYARERDAAQSALVEARQARAAARQQLDGEESEASRLGQEVAAARSRRENLASRMADTRSECAQVKERLAALDAVAAAGSGNAEMPGADDHEAAKSRRQAADTALRDARARLEAAERRSASAARSAMNADNAVDEAREAMQRARIAVETASARRDGLVEQLEELQADAAALLAHLDEQATVEAWHARIEDIERKIARLGAINLAAIEEHDSEAEREQYLSEQHRDLTEALETLENAIARIDRETRSRFKETFTQVNQRFGAMFPILFGGGHASLELTEDDLLSTGVRVMARPPGKRNASIQMLSGGEKALTAMALLFALFELNPAPFCMLDEIDAPLDDANVSRFCELLRQMSAHIQFIVITHNKVTMELAEQLHGVTMAEPGVSRLVSVNVDQALDMAG